MLLVFCIMKQWVLIPCPSLPWQSWLYLIAQSPQACLFQTEAFPLFWSTPLQNLLYVLFILFMFFMFLCLLCYLRFIYVMLFIYVYLYLYLFFPFSVHFYCTMSFLRSSNSGSKSYVDISQFYNIYSFPIQSGFSFVFEKFEWHCSQAYCSVFPQSISNVLEKWFWSHFLLLH